MIKADRPLAMKFMAISPFASHLNAKSLFGVSAAGQKKGILWRLWR
jgi:hypothetical protein